MSQELANAVQARSDLQKMLDTAGWNVFCTRFDEKFKDLTEKILNPKTSAMDAECLRHARAAIKDTFAPQVLIRDYITTLEAKIDREQQKEFAVGAKNLTDLNSA